MALPGAVVEFIECTSLNISYNVMGIATVTFSVVSNQKTFPSGDLVNTITVGTPSTTFAGYVTDAYMQAIPNTVGWYETKITLISIATK